MKKLQPIVCALLALLICVSAVSPSLAASRQKPLDSKALQTALQSGDVTAQLAALEAVKRQKAATAGTIELVAGLLSTTKDERRNSALDAFVICRMNHAAATPGLAALLSEKQGDAQDGKILFALQLIGSDAHAACPALVERIADRRFVETHSKALSTLAIIARTEQERTVARNAIRPYMDGKDWRMKARAIDAMGRVGVTQEDEQAIAEALKTPNSVLNRSAAIALHRSDISLKPYLGPMLADSDQRARAMDMLIAVKAPVPELASDIAPFVGSRDERLQMRAYQLLESWGAKAGGAAAELGKLCAGDDPRAITWAMLLLRRLGPDAAPAAQHIVKLIDHKRQDWRYLSLRILAQCGAAGAAATPTLMARVKAGGIDESERPSVLSALASVGRKQPDAVRLVADALKDKDPGIRLAALLAMGPLGPDAAPAVPQLIAALDDENAAVRATASSVLGEIGAAAADALPRLIKLRKDSSMAVRLKVVRAIDLIRNDAIKQRKIAGAE